MSSIYHGQLTVSIFGQSHAPAIGVTVDGLPAGERVDLETKNQDIFLTLAKIVIT